MSDIPPPRPPKPSRLKPDLPEKAQQQVFSPSSASSISPFTSSTSPPASPSTSHSDSKDDGYHIMSACPDVELVGEPIPLETLTRERYAEFPLNVVIADSMYGVCEDRTLMEGEPLTLHFLKRTKIGVLESDNGMEYTVPWNSAFQFSPVYDPIKQPRESLKGFTFHSAVDLMVLEKMPPLVKVTANYDGGHPNNSVQAGEVLAKLETIYDPNSKKKWLKCINIKTGHEKQLSSNCIGKFSTKPSFFKYYLPEFAGYLHPPAKLMFLPSPFPLYKLPPQFINTFFTYTEQRLHQTVVASGQISAGSYGTVRQRKAQVQRLIELSLEADIDVQLLQTPARELKNLAESSKHIYNTFEPSLVERMVINTSPITNQIQLELYRAVRLDCWKAGLEVVQPCVKHEPQQLPRSTTSNPNDAYDYPWIVFPGPQKQKFQGKSKSRPKPTPSRAHHSPIIIPPPRRSPPAQSVDDDDGDYFPMDDSLLRDDDGYEITEHHSHDFQKVMPKATDTGW